MENQFWTQPDALRSWIGIVQRENVVNEAFPEYGFVSQLSKVPLETESTLLPQTQQQTLASQVWRFQDPA